MLFSFSLSTTKEYRSGVSNFIAAWFSSPSWFDYTKPGQPHFLDNALKIICSIPSKRINHQRNSKLREGLREIKSSLEIVLAPYFPE